MKVVSQRRNKLSYTPATSKRTVLRHKKRPKTSRSLWHAIEHLLEVTLAFLVRRFAPVELRTLAARVARAPASTGGKAHRPVLLGRLASTETLARLTHRIE